MKPCISQEKSINKYSIIGEILLKDFFNYDKENIAMSKGGFRTVSLDTCCKIVKEVCKNNLKYHHSTSFANKIGVSRSQLMNGMKLLETMGILKRELQKNREIVIYNYKAKKPYTQPKKYSVVHTFLKTIKEAYEDNWQRIKTLKPVYKNVFNKVSSLFEVATGNCKRGHKRRFLNSKTGEYTIKISRCGKKWWDYKEEKGGGIGQWILSFVKKEQAGNNSGELFQELQNYKLLFSL